MRDHDNRWSGYAGPQKNMLPSAAEHREPTMKTKSMLVIFAVAAALLLPLGASAQQERDMIEVLRAQINTDRQAVVALNMELSEKQSEAFWPVYREYHEKRDELADRRVKLLMEFRDNQVGMTAEQASQILKDAIDLEDKLNDLKHNYRSDFEKVLGPRHALRYYQIENKLDAVINYELASVVPLRQ
jgi:pyruvate formate-lyase activating enzyme-like uncharacterized protein